MPVPDVLPACPVVPGVAPPAQARLRLLRRQQALTLEALAQMSGLTKSYLSKVERGLSMPSVAAALNIARALGVEVGALFGVETADDAISVIRAGGHVPLAAPGAAQPSARLLAAQLADKHMQPFLLAPPPDFADTPAARGHAGEEFLYVLQGEVEIAFPERCERLAAGDALYFRAALPHRLRRLSAAAEVLIVISRD